MHYGEAAPQGILVEFLFGGCHLSIKVDVSSCNFNVIYTCHEFPAKPNKNYNSVSNTNDLYHLLDFYQCKQYCSNTKIWNEGAVKYSFFVFPKYPKVFSKNISFDFFYVDHQR